MLRGHLMLRREFLCLKITKMRNSEHNPLVQPLKASKTKKRSKKWLAEEAKKFRIKKKEEELFLRERNTFLVQ